MEATTDTIHCTRRLTPGGRDPLSLHRYDLETLTDPRVVAFRQLLLSLDADLATLIPEHLTPEQQELAHEQVDKTKQEVEGYLHDAVVDALCGLHDESTYVNQGRIYLIHTQDGVPACTDITAAGSTKG